MPTIRKGLVKRIHVNQRVIRNNRKTGRTDPPITIQTSRGPKRAMGVTIHGSSRFMYRPLKPLKCGARLWIETDAEVFYEYG